MNAKELRRRFVDFFISKGHFLAPSAPLIPYDVTGHLDETLLFTGAGMVQFKPYFLGHAVPSHRCLVTSQKCLRAVDIEEVGNPSHLTFFEMLGNFSFGDYFKKEAIDYAWEFLISSDGLGLDPHFLCVTVFEEDDESFSLWSEHWSTAGFEPINKIHRLGEEKNAWPAHSFSKGPPGPCGPCSEIFYQTVSDEEMTGNYLLDESFGRWLEIWNLVFMQYEWRGHLQDSSHPHLGYVRDSLELLPQHNVDTGMGLERTAAVLGGFSSVYETDVFSPIVEAILSRSDLVSVDDHKLRYVRVIADHLRAATFCIEDGILPSNTGRGYVLRRLLRRALHYASQNLGIQLDTPYLSSLLPSVLEALGDAYPNLHARKDFIATELTNEETRFSKTIREGCRHFDDIMVDLQKTDDQKTFPGSEAFYLYDTFGFPVELTQELARQAGMKVDMTEFETCLLEAQQRSRTSHGADHVFFRGSEPILLITSPSAQSNTEFVGHETTSCSANLVQISPRFNENELTTGMFQIALDRTPFYAESGGQVGDTGLIESDHFTFSVTDTWSELGITWHDARLIRFNSDHESPLAGIGLQEISNILNSGVFFSPVTATVDEIRRKDIMRNHTATHLLHAALRQVLGLHVTQAGSLVAPDRLRFDFTHGKSLTNDEIIRVERIVNEQIRAGKPITIHNDVPISLARERGAMMLFGEKYGDSVRMVEVPDFSLELCGGTHVLSTDRIGLFKVVSESSIASGVRRIECLTGFGAYEWVSSREKMIFEISRLLKANPLDLPRSIERLQSQLRELRTEREHLLSSRHQDDNSLKTFKIGDIDLYIQNIEVGGLDAAKLVVDRIVEQNPSAVALVSVIDGEKVVFICKIGEKAVAYGAHAGDLLQSVAKVAGGAGGGRPSFAQAGAKNPEKIQEALNIAGDVLRSQIARH